MQANPSGRGTRVRPTVTSPTQQSPTTRSPTHERYMTHSRSDTTHVATPYNDKPRDNSGEMTESRRFRMFWQRLRGKHLKHVPTLWESIKSTILASWLNLLFIFVPLSWISHFLHWPEKLVFALSFVALIPLERIFQFGGDQMTFYLGKQLGDLLVITLMNTVEAILAIILLIKCNIKLVQATVIGVVILQLLLVPGAGFLTGGLRQVHQELHHTAMQMNHTLLTMGVLAIALPATMHAASQHLRAEPVSVTVTDALRHMILQISRGVAVTLIIVYVLSRCYQFNPPGDDNALELGEDAPKAAKEYEEKLKRMQPKVGPGFCILLLIVAVALVAFTAEWLVDSIKFAKEEGKMGIEFFGLIILPLISFSGDGIITFSYLIRRAFWHTGDVPRSLSDARPIDLSIQFTLFWIPFLVLLAWIIDKPLTLLFDLFEVIMLIGSCFLVNSITADSKTNWAEGATMIAFYAIIGLAAWFYVGEEAVNLFSYCGSIADV